MSHIHSAIDFTVEVFIVYDQKVLLRKHDKYGIWLSIGGHIELDEDPLQAALREVKEEVGLKIELYHDPVLQLTQRDSYRELIPPQFMNRHKINDTHEHVTLVYFARSSTDQLLLSQTERSSGCRWFTREELDQPQYGINDHIKMYARSALEKVINDHLK